MKSFSDYDMVPCDGCGQRICDCKEGKYVCGTDEESDN